MNNISQMEGFGKFLEKFSVGNTITWKGEDYLIEEETITDNSISIVARNYTSGGARMTCDWKGEPNGLEPVQYVKTIELGTPELLSIYNCKGGTQR